MRKPLLWFSVLVLALAVAAPAAAAPTASPGVLGATTWLRAQQRPDGGYAGFGNASDGGSTADAALAFAAADVDPSLVLAADHSVADFLAAAASSYGATTGGAANLVLAAVASGLNPYDLGGANLVARIQASFSQGTGLYNAQLYVDALAVLALKAAGATIPSAALDALVHGQAADGGWAFTGATQAGQSDTNTTSVVIQALVAGGRAPSPAITSALAYLHTAQVADGSFVYQVGAESPPVGDANSTALVVQALVAAGQDPNAATWHQALAALQHFQNPDGAFRYRDDTPGDNVLATVQAIPALLLKPLPIAPGASFGHVSALQRATQPETPVAGCTYVAVTQHNLCAGFRAFWNRYGGLATYGYPLTEEFVQNGLTVQYFERARFEWHPGSNPARYDVELGLVGDEVTVGRATQVPFQPTTPVFGCTYFAATGHNLCAGFGAYWNQFGGLATYGMPISEEFPEQNPDTGQIDTVQYFERARFEWHPGADPVHFDVALGRLGAAALQAR